MGSNQSSPKSPKSASLQKPLSKICAPEKPPCPQANRIIKSESPLKLIVIKNDIPEKDPKSSKEIFLKKNEKKLQENLLKIEERGRNLEKLKDNSKKMADLSKNYRSMASQVREKEENFSCNGDDFFSSIFGKSMKKESTKTTFAENSEKNDHYTANQFLEIENMEEIEANKSRKKGDKTIKNTKKNQGFASFCGCC